jgi:hypothetical protein
MHIECGELVQQLPTRTDHFWSHCTMHQIDHFTGEWLSDSHHAVFVMAP